ncbi:MAG: hypothetical protein D3924_02035 [Candidatus Electrothrix sp. AR4]|nr:hypothetical protein [Candidatus Electrothrix sp. AR4]
MPIFSYLALPKTNAMEELTADLSSMKYCEIIPSDNQEVVVLITDTPDENAEKELQYMLKRTQSLQSLSMTFGHKAE